MSYPRYVHRPSACALRLPHSRTAHGVHMARSATGLPADAQGRAPEQRGRDPKYVAVFRGVALSPPWWRVAHGAGRAADAVRGGWGRGEAHSGTREKLAEQVAALHRRPVSLWTEVTLDGNQEVQHRKDFFEEYQDGFLSTAWLGLVRQRG